MAQVVVWSSRAFLAGRRERISDAVHGAVMAAWDYPADKRFHRFVPLDPEDFVYPPDRGPEDELIVRLEAGAGIPPHSLEVTITETPKVNWGIRGANAADLELGYRVDV
jgi:hypothetical protein